jgi:2-polyprenyl-3-methyl-5-hydroxy-6-metoxy-1,4-benzoquinol methylase
MPLAPRRVRCGVVVGNVIETIARNPLPDALRERSQRVWSAGDYDSIAAGFRDDAAAFVERQRLKRGMRVLDAACGSGNLTIPAARTGATVVGLDLVWSLIEQASSSRPRSGASAKGCPSSSTRVRSRTCRTRTSSSTRCSRCSA